MSAAAIESSLRPEPYGSTRWPSRWIAARSSDLFDHWGACRQQFQRLLLYGPSGTLSQHLRPIVSARLIFLAAEDDKKASELRDRPELIFGVVRALGTDTKTVLEPLESQLNNAQFIHDEVRISKEFRKLTPLNTLLEEKPLDRRYESYMNAGDLLRASTERPDACGILGVQQIREKRPLNNDVPGENCRGRAFIVRHLMTPEEVHTLRRIYGERLFTISIFSPREIREDRLTELIADSRNVKEEKRETCRPRAVRLLNRDFGLVDETDPVHQELAERKEYRLNVRNTFQESDLFLSVEDSSESEAAIERFVELIFSHPFHTPTIDEYGMAMARIASLRSADLARRVGAAILTKDGQLLATGTNDAPKFGGGLYWSDDDPDRRDWKLGKDFSEEIRRKMLGDVMRRLGEDPSWLVASSELAEEKIDEILDGIDLKQAVDSALASDHVREGRVFDVTEYGRSVHAEMSALMDAARRGIAVPESTLYCTTFPCHHCARHIIASGIDRVVYIEPYPKSMAGRLYAQEIGLGSRKGDVTGKVSFEPFVGIAPQQLQEIMAWVPRKMSDLEGGEGSLKGRPVKPNLSSDPIRWSILDEYAATAGAVRASVEAMENYFIEGFEPLLHEMLQEMAEASEEG